MKLYILITLGLLYLLIAGCTETEQDPFNEQLINTELINTYNDIAIQNAIISQHTLFPYHFVKDGAELNELGQRDLDILAAHLIEHPGLLNVRRDNSSDDLYKTRVDFVLGKLKQAGINTERISISDGMPGGTGMPSESVLTILERSDKISTAKTSTTYKSKAK